ncbi:hypothetical protein [Streptomyces sp. NPDC047024]|uniref:hypothetical protein n=1 Tax=Streptomyces sp. NPDC047024 TaxID=3155476 RepID=UPI0033D4E4F9
MGVLLKSAIDGDPGGSPVAHQLLDLDTRNVFQGYLDDGGGQGQEDGDLAYQGCLDQDSKNAGGVTANHYGTRQVQFGTDTKIGAPYKEPSRRTS